MSQIGFSAIWRNHGSQSTSERSFRDLIWIMSFHQGRLMFARKAGNGVRWSICAQTKRSPRKPCTHKKRVHFKTCVFRCALFVAQGGKRNAISEKCENALRLCEGWSRIRKCASMTDRAPLSLHFLAGQLLCFVARQIVITGRIELTHC